MWQCFSAFSRALVLLGRFTEFSCCLQRGLVPASRWCLMVLPMDTHTPPCLEGRALAYFSILRQQIVLTSVTRGTAVLFVDLDSDAVFDVVFQCDAQRRCDGFSGILLQFTLQVVLSGLLHSAPCFLVFPRPWLGRLSQQRQFCQSNLSRQRSRHLWRPRLRQRRPFSMRRLLQ